MYAELLKVEINGNNGRVGAIKKTEKC